MALPSPYLRDTDYDALLAGLTGVNLLHYVSALPNDYAGVAAVTLGNKAGSFGAAADRAGGGRERTFAAFTDGTQTGAGTATHVIAVNTSDSSIRAIAPLAGSGIPLTGSGVFPSSAIVIGTPDIVAA